MAFLVKHLTHAFVPLGEAIPADFSYSLLLNEVLAETDSLPLSYANGLLVAAIDYRIDQADTENIYEKITQLGEAHFDWLIDINRWVRLYAPSAGSVNSYIFEKGRNLINLPYEDTGPDGNHIFGLGSGTASRLGAVYNNAASTAIHRRLDHSVDFGSDSIDQTHLDELVAAEGARAIKHKLQITTPVMLDYIDEVLDSVSLGDTCRVIGSNFHKTIDQNFRIIGFEGSESNDGVETLSLIMEDAS